MITSILFKELERSNNLSSCYDFWGISPCSGVELFEKILGKIDDLSIVSLLEGLRYKEAEFFYLLLKNGGTATSIELFQNKFLWENDFEAISNSLKSKYLIYIRKTISHVKIVPYSYSIYPEILKAIRRISVITIPELAKDFSININSTTNSDILDRLFIVNLGQYSVQRLSDLGLGKKLLERLASGQCTRGLLFNKRFYFIAITDRVNLGNINPLTTKGSSYKKLFFLLRLYQSYFQIMTNGIYLTSKNQIRKHDSKFLSKIFLQDSTLQECVLKFLEDSGFIYISKGQYRANSSMVGFLKKSINEKLDIVVNIYPKVKMVFDLSIKLGKDCFNCWDIAQQYFIDRSSSFGYFSYDILNDKNLSYDDIVAGLDFLFQAGLLKCDVDGYSLSYLGEVFIEGKSIENSSPISNGGIIVNSDHTLLVYPEKLSEYHSFLVELFACRESDDIIWEYNIRKDTIQRGVYLGFSHKEFIKCLEVNSLQELPDTIVYNINSWAQRLKRVFVKKLTVLTGDRDILELLQYDRDFGQRVEKIGDGYLLYDNDNGDPPNYIQSDDEVFLIRDGDSLCNEEG